VRLSKVNGKRCISTSQRVGARFSRPEQEEVLVNSRKTATSRLSVRSACHVGRGGKKPKNHQQKKIRYASHPSLSLPDPAGKGGPLLPKGENLFLGKIESQADLVESLPIGNGHTGPKKKGFWTSGFKKTFSKKSPDPDEPEETVPKVTRRFSEDREKGPRRGGKRRKAFEHQGSAVPSTPRTTCIPETRDETSAPRKGIHHHGEKRLRGGD